MIVKYRTRFNDSLLPELVKESEYEFADGCINSPEKVVDMMRRIFSIDRETEEYMYEVCLNAKGRVLAVFETSHGAVDHTLVSPREFFQKALLAGAVSVIAVHNHPSGDCTPSKEDKDCAARLRKSGELIGIQLADFIIVGDFFYSFLQEKVL